MFSELEKSTFKYWFAHWCAYQMTALNLKVWRPKYLLHDAEKPWLKLFFEYPKVQKWHRKWNSHHLGKKGENKKVDYEAAIIDWECSRFTKLAAPRDAYETYIWLITEKADKYDANLLKEKIPPILQKLGLWHN